MHLELIGEAARGTDAVIRVCWTWTRRGDHEPLAGRGLTLAHNDHHFIPRKMSSACRASCRVAAGELGRAQVFYEAQIAGLGNQPLDTLSAPEQSARCSRAPSVNWLAAWPRIVAAVNNILMIAKAPALESGQRWRNWLIELCSRPEVTEVTAGSGFFAPTLFDLYRHFQPAPAAAFALPVVRTAERVDTVTVLGGGYVASGIADISRLPTPWLPEGLTLDSQEGAGEVQTPFTAQLRADWPRRPRSSPPRKAYELAERFEEFSWCAAPKSSIEFRPIAVRARPSCRCLRSSRYDTDPAALFPDSVRSPRSQGAP